MFKYILKSYISNYDSRNVKTRKFSFQILNVYLYIFSRFFSKVFGIFRAFCNRSANMFTNSTHVEFIRKDCRVLNSDWENYFDREGRNRKQYEEEQMMEMFNNMNFKSRLPTVIPRSRTVRDVVGRVATSQASARSSAPQARRGGGRSRLSKREACVW